MDYRKFKTLFYIGGAFNFLLALFHLFFWQIFNWPESISSLSRDNSGILQVSTIHLIIVILMFAGASFFYYQEMFATKIGRFVSGSIAAFYFIRVINEIIFWDITAPDSLGIAVICILLGIIYSLPAYAAKKNK